MTTKEYNIGNLKVLYNEEDYTKEISSNKTMTMMIFMSIATLLIIIGIIISVIKVEILLPNLSEVWKVIIAFMIALLIILCISLLSGFSIKKIYKDKDGLYNFLDNVYKLRDFNIFYTSEEKRFLFAFKYPTETKFYGKKYIQEILQVENELVEWNTSEFTNIQDKTILTIDLTQYPKTKFKIFQEN